MTITQIDFDLPQLLGGRVIAYPAQSFSDNSQFYIKKIPLLTEVVPGSGAFSASLPATEETGILFTFELQQAGKNVPPDAAYTTVDTLSVIIPKAGPVKFADLTGNFYSPSTVDSSHSAIARILSQDSNFASQLSGFVEKTYTPAEQFKPGEFCFEGDGLFVWQSASQGNVDPKNAANVGAGKPWRQAYKWPTPPAGTAIARTYTEANTSFFETLTTEPASRANIGELAELIKPVDIVAGSNTFSGANAFSKTVTAKSPPIDSDNSNLATTAWVRAVLGSIPASSNSTSTPGSLTPFIWMRRGKLIGTVTQGEAAKDIYWNEAPREPGRMEGNKSIVFNSAGLFLLLAVFDLQLRAEYSQAYGTQSLKINLIQYSASQNKDVPLGALMGWQSNEEARTLTNCTTGFKVFQASAGDKMRLQLVNDSPRLAGNSFADIVSASYTNNLIAFKLA